MRILLGGKAIDWRGRIECNAYRPEHFRDLFPLWDRTRYSFWNLSKSTSRLSLASSAKAPEL